MVKEKKLTKKSLVTVEYVKDAVAKNKIKAARPFAGNFFDALSAYANSKKKKLTFAFIASIKPDEKIYGIGPVGMKLLAAIQKDIAKMA